MAAPTPSGQRARWIIFALVALCAVLPLYVDFQLPGFQSKVVNDLHRTV